MPFSIRVLPRIETAWHRTLLFARTHKLACLLTLGLVGLGTVALVNAQAVSRTGQAQLRLPVLAGSLRKTNENFSTTYTPFWHFLLDPLTAIDSSATLTRNVAFTYSLTNRCSVPAGAPAGTISFSDVSGSYPTGITRTAGTISGTPTTVQTTTPTVRCTFTPSAGSATITDQALSFDVIDPDSAAPSVPINVVVAPVSSTELSVSWTPSIDASGIQNYDLSYATSEASCTNSDLNVETDANPPNTLSALVAGTTYWFKLRARDNSAAHNVSAWTTCVSGTTLGGGGGTPLIFDEGFETVTVPTDPNDNTHPLFRASTTGVNASNLLQSSTLHAREGTKSLRTKVTKSGTSAYRQELTVKTSLQDTLVTGSEDYWFGESTYVPSTSSLVSGSVRWQWHTWGTDCCSPIWGLRIVGGNYRVTQEGTTSNVTITLAAVATNEWTDWVAQIRWRKDTTGYIKIWRNGTLVVDRPNDQTAPDQGTLLGYLKIGLYVSTWTQSGNGDANGTVQEQFQDALRICYGNACTYNDVAPQGNRLTAP